MSVFQDDAHDVPDGNDDDHDDADNEPTTSAAAAAGRSQQVPGSPKTDLDFTNISNLKETI